MFRIKDSAVALGSTVTAQLLFFACVAVIARSYGPEALGVFNGDVALGMFLGTILAFRYELACVSDSRAISLTSLRHALTLASASTIALGILLYFLFSKYTVVVFAMSFFAQQAVAHYLNSLRHYVAIAFLRVLVNALLLASLITAPKIFGSVEINPFYEFAFVTLTLSTASVFLILFFNRKCRNTISFYRFIHENLRFASYTLPATLLASVSLYALSILVPRWFDAIAAGYFAAAYRFGAFPVSLIAQSIGGVLRRDAVSAVAKGAPLLTVLRPYAAMLSILAAAYVIAGITLYTTLVSLFLGEKWQHSAIYFHALMPFFALQLIYIPLSQVFLATKSQRIDLLIQLVSAISLASALIISKISKFTLLGTSLAFSIGGSLVLLFGLFVIFRVSADSHQKNHSEITDELQATLR
ncbi:lipopolysaccharide biosynthesis protein [Cupriavidus sp. 2TAF22]|uniref:lipopolysaccharide biosynthesis protein n=1 Tax=unclassified Cupriavidus TaxID=2640874 RepID=UPI003F909C3F